MSAERVVHILGSDTLEPRALVAQAAAAHSDARLLRWPIARPHTEDLGPGEPPSFSTLWTSLLENLSARRTRRWASAHGLETADIVHLWSPSLLPPMLQWVASASQRGRAPVILTDADGSAPARVLARWWHARPAGARLGFVATTDSMRRRLIACGVDPNDLHHVEPGVDYQALRAARAGAARTHVRSTCGLTNDAPQHVLLIAPPVTGNSGGLLAAWGALLAEKLYRGLRLIVPGHGREVDRVLDLATRSEHFGLVIRAGHRFSLAELVCGVDAVLWTPRGEAPVDALAWALAAGCPALCSATPANTEWVVHMQSGRLCQPDSPHDIARRVVELFDDLSASREMAERGAQAAFGRLRSTAAVSALSDVYTQVARGPHAAIA